MSEVVEALEEPQRSAPLTAQRWAGRSAVSSDDEAAAVRAGAGHRLAMSGLR